MKTYKKLSLISTVMILVLTFTCNIVYAQEGVSFPIADGIDYGSDEIEVTPLMFMKSYSYNTSEFSIGVYLKNGESFPVNRKNKPYIKNAKHSKIKNNDPDLYRVTYQAIYADSGDVRQGIPFVGPITDIEVKFSITETDDFKFYIAGDGTNKYTASGKLYYGGI